MRSPYDRIGVSYQETRAEDPRLKRRILEALDTASTVVNVGAGTGSYEPTDRYVVAVEPSETMIRQRRSAYTPVVRAVAESLPFSDRAFAAGMAVLTMHHWRDRGASGLRELSRVVRERVVIVTFDPRSFGFWLTRDYFPEFIAHDLERTPTIDELTSGFARAEVFPLPVPHDCVDGFLGAFWRRPEAYLDAAVRRGMSSFATSTDLSPLSRLEEDLKSGAWEDRNRAILLNDELDLGYRLVVGTPPRLK